MDSAVSLHHFPIQWMKNFGCFPPQPYTVTLRLSVSGIHSSFLSYCLQVSFSRGQRTRLDVRYFAVRSFMRSPYQWPYCSIHASALLAILFVLSVATCGVKLLKQLLHAILYQQLFANLHVSQSDQVQHLLLSVVSYRPQSCTLRHYICLLRTQPTLSALVISRQILQVDTVSHCAEVKPEQSPQSASAPFCQ